MMHENVRQISSRAVVSFHVPLSFKSFAKASVFKGVRFSAFFILLLTNWSCDWKRSARESFSDFSHFLNGFVCVFFNIYIVMHESANLAFILDVLVLEMVPVIIVSVFFKICLYKVFFGFEHFLLFQRLARANPSNMFVSCNA